MVSYILLSILAKVVVVANRKVAVELVIPAVNQVCTVNWHVEWPLDPSLPTFPPDVEAQLTTNGGYKLEPNFLLGFAVNGIPLYNAQERDNTSAVEPPEGSPVEGAKFWHGHPAATSM